MSAALLTVDGVAKAFPGVQALSDMHLDLRSGEVLALVGENGAGKSTLMKLLTGIHQPDAGTFRLDGEEFRPRDPAHARDLGIGIIHQEFNLMPHLTVAQNIYLGREPRRGGFLLSERALNARADALVERLGLPLDVRATVGSLTVAGQQMVEIAKALSHDARVLIMDEPTAALNDAEVATLHDLIRGFVTDGTGVVYISHRMDELRAISDRITVIRDGRFVRTLETADTDLREVIALMVGRELSGAAGPVGIRVDREPALRVDRLSTPGFLRDIGFDLGRGEILGVAGLMGAGRTELARALVGADRRSGGRIEKDGVVIAPRNPAEAARHGIGYLSEDRKHLGLLLSRDVAWNVALPSLADRLSRRGVVRAGACRAVARDQVNRLSIRTPSVEAVVRNLSGGNQQKVVIAKWLVKDCDVLIFDEPTRGIDVGAKDEIYALLNELADRGTSILMISSDLPEVLRMSHRVLVMAEGRVSGVLTAAEATQESVMHLATQQPEENL